MWINSPGGDVNAFFAIYDVMNIIKAEVHTYCIGQASSAGASLLSSGTKRYCTQNASIMIHHLSSGVGGTAVEIEIETKEIKRVNKKLTEILARNTGQSIAKVNRDCKNDKYMTAEEALKYGIVDEILMPTKKIPELKTTSSKK
jgi:ATP-dependent Clp protease protease subunit